MTVAHLFVYGTLAPGKPNEHVLARIGGSFQPATLRGHLKSEGWGAGMGFPGILPDENGPQVAGFVFTSGNLAAHWAELDEFEGPEYQRVEAWARLEGGKRVRAWVYALRDH